MKFSDKMKKDSPGFLRFVSLVQRCEFLMRKARAGDNKAFENMDECVEDCQQALEKEGWDLADEEICDCEKPGYFCSGVPGIIAHLVDDSFPPGVSPGNGVERCDLCQRYASDEEAYDELEKRRLIF